jgi:dTDP-4-amino-4,6-dideoxygalactose transaminase
MKHLADNPFCRYGPLPWTENAADRGLALPMYAGLDQAALDTVAGTLADCLSDSAREL